MTENESVEAEKAVVLPPKEFTNAPEMTDEEWAELGMPPQYFTGSVKRNPETLAVAVRTSIQEDAYPNRTWAVMTIDRGGHYANWSEVETWDDLYINPTA